MQAFWFSALEGSQNAAIVYRMSGRPFHEHLRVGGDVLGHRVASLVLVDLFSARLGSIGHGEVGLK